MAEHQAPDESWNEEDEGPVLQRRPMRESTDMDITPMIDVTFLLLIFFLVCSTLGQQTAIELPPARHGTAVGPQSSVIITVKDNGPKEPPTIYLEPLADGDPRLELSRNEQEQEDDIVAHVERGKELDKPTVLIKAEKGVKHREVARVARAAGQVEKIKLHLAVFEID